MFFKRAQKKQDQTNQPPEDQFKRLSLNSSINNNSNIKNETELNTAKSQNASNQITSHESVSLSFVSENEKSSIKTQSTSLSSVQNNIISINPTLDSSNISININNNNNQLSESIQNTNGDNSNNDENGDEEDDDEVELPPISAASMLTRKDVKEFKDSVRRDNDAIIKVGSGETVTVSLNFNYS